MTDDFNKDDEIIEIKLPRSEAEILRVLIKERRAYSFVYNKLKNWWIWSIGAGILAIIAFWDSISKLFKMVG